MPSPGTLTTRDLARAAEQIGPRIGSLLQVPYPQVALGRLLQVCLLDEPKDYSSLANIHTITCPTDVIHHQILLDGEAGGYARMSFRRGTDEANPWKFLSLILTETARKIEDAYRVLTERDAGKQNPMIEDSIRLLLLPLHHATALWKKADDLRLDELIVVEAPPGSSFEPSVRLNGGAFVSRLLEEGPASGLMVELYGGVSRD